MYSVDVQELYTNRGREYFNRFFRDTAGPAGPTGIGPFGVGGDPASGYLCDDERKLNRALLVVFRVRRWTCTITVEHYGDFVVTTDIMLADQSRFITTEAGLCIPFSSWLDYSRVGLVVRAVLMTPAQDSYHLYFTASGAAPIGDVDPDAEASPFFFQDASSPPPPDPDPDPDPPPGRIIGGTLEFMGQTVQCLYLPGYKQIDGSRVYYYPTKVVIKPFKYWTYDGKYDEDTGLLVGSP